MTKLERGAERVGEHDWHDAGYVDAWIAERIEGDPGHLARLDRMAGLVALATTAASPRVLDVGTGPGVLAGAVLRAIPSARVVCVDFSVPMLERARTALAWAGDRTAYHRCDLHERDWAAGVEGPFDVVMASYSIHNLRESTRIRAAYTDMVGLLAPGGCLFVLDLVDSPGSRLDPLYGRKRRQDDAEPAALATQLGWLARAGLAEIDCIWKDGFEALLCGFRP